MMGIGEAPALRSIEREEPATRSDEPGEGGVEGKKMLTLVELICRISVKSPFYQAFSHFNPLSFILTDRIWGRYFHNKYYGR